MRIMENKETLMKNLKMKYAIKVIFCLQLFAFSIVMNAQENCELIDKIEIVNIIDEENSLEISEVYIYGIENSKLVNQASLNGNQNTKEALDSLILTKIPEDLFRSEQYKIFEVNFIINTESELENLFLTSEIFWFMADENGDTQYNEISKGNPIEIEMAKSMMGYIELELINDLKDLITSQLWKPGICEGDPVTTLMTITLNDF